MEQKTLIESLIAVAPMPNLGSDVYANEKPFTSQPTSRAVFGGLLLAQAISAASATVNPGFNVYSSQSSFLRPVTAAPPKDSSSSQESQSQKAIFYHVERTSDGRSYATRVVRATQTPPNSQKDDNDEGAPCAYVAIISFQRESATTTPTSNTLTYGVPMPAALDGLKPDDIPEDANRRLIDTWVGEGTGFSFEDPSFDWRPFGFVFEKDNPCACRTRGVRGGDGSEDGDGGPLLRNVVMNASLTHSISFHDPGVRVDQWLVVERETSWGADGRVLVHQRAWDFGTGRLVMSCVQEALIRLRGAGKL
ncbi:putative acyl- thioesterase ii protein [Eutypa lata UCREL1]|uniref:Putative acyl-thioesterase ii protein n=1 Tax=Eutypa lata (strain UCR-EL1) TaxID=1287681 RepID=M7T6S2_EUTLA|nr:putative acyl- thioesterase ii protein [Eutypa lata UCREL1]